MKTWEQENVSHHMPKLSAATFHYQILSLCATVRVIPSTTIFEVNMHVNNQHDGSAILHMAYDVLLVISSSLMDLCDNQTSLSAAVFDFVVTGRQTQKESTHYML